MQITIHPKRKLRALGDLFGIFFEDLNHAADGGLYAEMVRNRSFDFQPADRSEYTALTAWEAIADANISIENTAPVFANKPNYLRIEAGVGGGVRNLGYGEGMYFDKGAKYELAFYARAEKDCILSCALEGAIAAETLEIVGGWNKYNVTLTANDTCSAGRLALLLPDGGEIWLDQVSLFPQDTFMGKKGGLRRDIAEALKQMRPRFMRFPGGCLVHDGELNAQSHSSMYRWKNTVGDVDARPTRRSGWGYNQSLGLGFYEYFEFCEQIGAQPLPVVPGGCDPHHRRFAEGEQLQEFIQDALDLIEFARGGEETKWGSVRAKMGHPAPFGLKYIAVGNEEVHSEFYERLPLFVKAIRARYPDIKIIGSAGPFAAGSEFERGWQSARDTAIDLVDEHYYEPPEWLAANMERYQGYPADGPKVFLGEYASWGNNYENALYEAAYMVQMQNSPAVGLACYAPMLCRAEYVNWRPDMIWFNNRRLVKTPNYHVQSMFMRNQGDMELAADITGQGGIVEEATSGIAGGLSMFADRSDFEVSGISICDANGRRDMGDIELAADKMADLGSTQGDFVMECRARRIFGKVGIKINFGTQNAENFYTWCFGGWENQDSLIEKHINGRAGCLTQSEFSIESGREYTLRLEVAGRRIRTYIDGVLFNDTIDNPPAIRPLYTAFSLDSQSGDVIIKAVNITENSVHASILLEEMGGSELNAICEELKGHSFGDKNDFNAPDKVTPAISDLNFIGNSFEYEFAPESITVIRIASK